jgi:hypothetical protein
MQLESLGHESWLVTGFAGAQILVDPLLSRIFGRHSLYRYRKSSHVELPSSQLSQVVGVVLTTEHFQHFDPDSLLMLDHKPSVYIGPSFGARAAAWLRDQRFPVVRAQFHESSTAAEFRIAFVPADPEAPAWDSRVCSVAIADKSAGLRKWLFFQSDTRVHRAATDFIPAAWFAKPSVVACTSHFCEYAAPGFSTWDNLIDPRESFSDPRHAFAVAAAALPLQVPALGVASHYVLTGGDYSRENHARPAPLRRNDELADLIRPLLLNSTVSVARGGLRLSADDDSVELSTTPRGQGGEVSDVAEPFEVTEVRDEDPRDASLIQTALHRYGTALLLSELGRVLLFRDTYLGRTMGSRRFALKLVGKFGETRFEFCFARSRFVDSTRSDEEMLELPAGLVLARSALADIVADVASAAEICTHNAVQWHPPGHECSPLGLLYETFAEVHQT